jgi:hypothetical protein
MCWQADPKGAHTAAFRFINRLYLATNLATCDRSDREQQSGLARANQTGGGGDDIRFERAASRKSLTENVTICQGGHETRVWLSYPSYSLYLWDKSGTIRRTDI